MPDDGVYAEIGIWCGRSFMATGLSVPAYTHLIGVDTFEGDETGAHELAYMAPEFIKI